MIVKGIQDEQCSQDLLLIKVVCMGARCSFTTLPCWYNWCLNNVKILNHLKSQYRLYSLLLGDSLNFFAFSRKFRPSFSLLLTTPFLLLLVCFTGLSLPWLTTEFIVNRIYLIVTIPNQYYRWYSLHILCCCDDVFGIWLDVAASMYGRGMRKWFRRPGYHQLSGERYLTSIMVKGSSGFLPSGSLHSVAPAINVVTFISCYL